MRTLSKSLGVLIVLGGTSIGSSGAALAQNARQVQQQERLVNVLLGQNQARINHEDNAIAQQNALLSLLPGKSPAQQAPLIRRIDQLNVNLAAAKVRLIGGLDKTAAALDRIDAATPPNPFVSSQLALYQQRANLIFSTELQEADAIINRPPASATSFVRAVDPLQIGRTMTVAHAVSVAQPTTIAPDSAGLHTTAPRAVPAESRLIPRRERVPQLRPERR